MAVSPWPMAPGWWRRLVRKSRSLSSATMLRQAKPAWPRTLPIWSTHKEQHRCRLHCSRLDATAHGFTASFRPRGGAVSRHPGEAPNIREYSTLRFKKIAGQPGSASFKNATHLSSFDRHSNDRHSELSCPAGPAREQYPCFVDVTDKAPGANLKPRPRFCPF